MANFFTKNVLGGVSSLGYNPKTVGSSIGLLFSGIALLTLNERRDMAQAKLREKAKGMCLTLEETDDCSSVDESLNGRLLHYHGTLEGDQAAEDYDIGVKNEKFIRLMRKVEMYQNHESRKVSYH